MCDSRRDGVGILIDIDVIELDARELIPPPVQRQRAVVNDARIGRWRRTGSRR